MYRLHPLMDALPLIILFGRIIALSSPSTWMVISVSFALGASVAACPAVIPVNDADMLFCRDLAFGMMDNLLVGEVCRVMAVDICAINKKKRGRKTGKCCLIEKELNLYIYIPDGFLPA